MAIYPVYTVRNSLGQFLGSFYAKNEKHAIERCKAADRQTASTFRKSQPAIKNWGELTAKIEGTGK